VQHEYGAPRRLCLVHTLANVHGDARHDARLRSGPFPGHGPVHVPAKQSGDLRVTLYDGLQRRDLRRPAIATDVMIADVEWRMVNKE